MLGLFLFFSHELRVPLVQLTVQDFLPILGGPDWKAPFVSLGRGFAAMPNSIRLYTNAQPFLVEVTYEGGQKATINVEPNEALYDEGRVIRVLSLHLNEGVENYFLLPRNQPADQALSLVADWLVPFGLSLAGSKLVEGKRFIDSLTKWLVFSKFYSSSVRDLCDRVRLANCGYFIANGHLVFEQPMYVPEDRFYK